MYIIFFFYFFSGGLTNLLYTCELSDNIQTRPGEARTVLLRVYGDIAKDLKFLVQNSVVFCLLSEKHLTVIAGSSHTHILILLLCINHNCYLYCCCVSIIIVICICPPEALIWLINLYGRGWERTYTYISGDSSPICKRHLESILKGIKSYLCLFESQSALKYFLLLFSKMFR
jgi:hypothetical protein